QETFSDPKKMKAQIDKALADIAKTPDLGGEAAVPLQRFLGELDQFIGKVDAQALAKSPFSGSARIKSVPVTSQVEGEPRSAYEITFPSAILWGLIGCIMTFAISLVTERTHGTLLRLRLAPLSWGRILAGKGLACYLTALLVAGLILVIGSL